MALKRFLILAPIILIALLAQSYFWVPTYDAQTTGNPDRVWKFIEASIGDAKILNPALNADSASSTIAGLVFEGLLDLDENLNLRGRLATAWSITEEAYLLVDTSHHLPDGIEATGEELLARFRQALDKGPLSDFASSVSQIELLVPERRREQLNVVDEDKEPRSIVVEILQPARIKFSLTEVDQDFFERLEPVLGAAYAHTLALSDFVRAERADEQRLIEPLLPELVPVFEHNPVILFHLRQGVLFHDGHEFDAGDVRFTYESIMSTRNLSPRTSDFEPVKHIEILDPYTVRVVYKRLFSPAINAWSMGVLPEHLLNAESLEREMDERNISAAGRESFGMRDSLFNRNPVGTGPFRFVEWQSDELIHLRRNDDYWDGPPQYRDYFYRVVPDPLTQEIEFLSGAVDSYAPQPHQISRYKRNTEFQSFSSLGFSYTYIGYNNHHPLLGDKQVRHALSMAIDVDEIIEYILYNEAERTTGPYPKNTQWYDHRIEPIPYDPEAALRILQELGWKRNEDGWLEKDGKIFEFNLITNNGNLVRKAVMTTVQNGWRKIGIKCNTQVFEWAVFLEDFVNPSDFDALILGWSMGIDPDLFQLWHSSEFGFAQLNFVGYENQEADELIVRIRREYELGMQRELAHELHRVIAEDQPYTFLFTRLATQVLDKKIMMVEDDGSFGPLRPTKSGNLRFFFNRWRKLEHTPSF